MPNCIRVRYLKEKMKQLIIFLLLTSTFFSQEKNDTIFLNKKPVKKDSLIVVNKQIDTVFVAKDSIKNNVKEELFTDRDLDKIDSLLVDEKFNSSLFYAFKKSFIRKYGIFPKTRTRF